VRGRFAAGPELLAQLNDLRDQNQRLNADIASLKLSAPEDAKEYEGGSDTVAIYGSYGIRAFGQAAGAWQVNATWDEVFSVLGPFMFDECDEGLMTKTLEDSLSWKDDNTAQMHVHLANDVLQTVKIQLLALGLIQKSVKKRALNNTASYWKLTPYGETYLLKLRAIRKEITS
jgi:hypothetical protein